VGFAGARAATTAAHRPIRLRDGGLHKESREGGGVDEIEHACALGFEVAHDRERGVAPTGDELARGRFLEREPITSAGCHMPRGT
jgi:hypothetical protein